MNQKIISSKNLTDIIFRGKSDNTYVQFFRYCFVGSFAAVLDTGLVVYLTSYLNVYYIISVTGGFVLGLIINYLLSSIWVFHRGLSSVSKSRHLTDIILFGVIGIIGLVMTIIIVWLLYDKLNFSILISKIIAVIIVLFWNFFGRKYLIFFNK